MELFIFLVVLGILVIGMLLGAWLEDGQHEEEIHRLESIIKNGQFSDRGEETVVSLSELDNRAASLCASVKRHADGDDKINVSTYSTQRRDFVCLGGEAKQFDTPEKCRYLLLMHEIVKL